ncbi:Carboxylesterase [BD1-7 clade bacterium]|uniref:Carboxylesterase n=1 Tax=BD1-7 clade bacterium TaxID=2029982 RepID=A0A5S9QLV2_9GAMM|nr:Carboxylesterase [BD1-7 clade bacterium]CAA0118792.1 Carboxylesterase [BD1-7 clade bacterium]
MKSDSSIPKKTLKHPTNTSSLTNKNTTFSADYSPKGILKNPHIQTVVSSSPLRSAVIRHRARDFLHQSNTIDFLTVKKVRLQIEFTEKNNNQKLAVLLHGWEGSAQSSYIVGLGNTLHKNGYSVARINFRDHGDTHHLNAKPFNSVRLQEVAEAVEFIYQRFAPKKLVMAGFSLGGNFALRLSAYFSGSALPLERTLSVCPAIDPVATTKTLENGPSIYHKYFVKKWRSSLVKKYRYFPEQMRSFKDLEAGSLTGMNAIFVPLHTDFDIPEEYLAAYRITQDTLDTITSPTIVAYAIDDPIIDAADFQQLLPTENVGIVPIGHGGHCAFISDWRLDSWVAEKALAYFEQPKQR